MKIETIADLLAGSIPEPSTGCYLWAAGRTEKGYGRIMVRGKNQRAHRVAWTLSNGPIPDGLHVLHKCDTPPCVNPDHLFLGTNTENMADMIAKGRAAARVILSDDDVREIRRRAAAGLTPRRIASSFGVGREHVRDIVSGKHRSAVV